MEEVSGHLPKSIVHRCIVRIVCSFRPFCFPSLSLFFLFLLYVFLCCPCFFPNLSTVLFIFTERLFTALGFSSFFLWVTCVLSWPTVIRCLSVFQLSSLGSHAPAYEPLTLLFSCEELSLAGPPSTQEEAPGTRKKENKSKQAKNRPWVKGPACGFQHAVVEQKTFPA